MTDCEKAFVQGFAVAVAEMLRHHVNAEDLLRGISATETLLRKAGVMEYDLVELRPVLRAMKAQDKARSRRRNSP